MSILFSRLSRLSSDSKPDRTWCGNDEKGNFTHHGVVPLSQDPVTIELSWKATTDSTPRYVGTFELHLKELLALGVIKEESGGVRVKFINARGLLLLTIKVGTPTLLLGLVLLADETPPK